MDGRAFLVVANELALGTTEAHWRAAAGRAYYALFLEARAALTRWGVGPRPRDPVHAAVRLRCDYASDADLRHVAFAPDKLSQLRNEADYRVALPGSFRDAKPAVRAVARATQALAALDQVEADASRKAAAATVIRARWP